MGCGKRTFTDFYGLCLPDFRQTLSVCVAVLWGDCYSDKFPASGAMREAAPAAGLSHCRARRAASEPARTPRERSDAGGGTSRQSILLPSAANRVSLRESSASKARRGRHQPPVYSSAERGEQSEPARKFRKQSDAGSGSEAPPPCRHRSALSHTATYPIANRLFFCRVREHRSRFSKEGAKARTFVRN